MNTDLVFLFGRGVLSVMSQSSSKSCLVSLETARASAPALPQKIGGLIADPHILTAWPQGWELCAKSAVLILFLTDGDQRALCDIVLTRRTTTVRSHKGQISFPGGRFEPGVDNSPVMTALRELDEEVGIAPASVGVLGRLAPFEAIDGSKVLPILGVSSYSRKLLAPNRNEVAEVMLPPGRIFQRSNADSFTFCYFGVSRHSYLYRYQEKRIWGLTAAMLYEADFLFEE
jgi:8-oxo-dGTP pyrophosphatase MutT (NUDIX family)